MAYDYTPKIPKTELEDRAYYQGECRNATVARWNAKTQLFYHWRVKMQKRFVETIHAPEDEDKFDVFITERKVEPPAEEIPIDWTEFNTKGEPIPLEIAVYFPPKRESKNE